MNKLINDTSRATREQASRLKNLIEDITLCCQERIELSSRKFGLTPAELRSLLLFHNERYLTLTTIAQRLEVAKSRVTKILEGLLKKKLIERLDDPKDSRVKLISLTPIGQKKAKEVDELMTELHHSLVLTLNTEDRKTVLSALEVLRASMDTIKKRLE
jgi:DNA-binding MarR family transcriptional regulator